MDPLEFYLQKQAFDTNEISKLVCGEKYLSIELNNGNIGVCATLDLPVKLKIEDLKNIDLSSYSHRIAVNAYINAQLNYKNTFSNQQDIFDKLDFTKYKKIVMVGYFKSLVDKFINAGIELTIFDKVKKDEILENMNRQPKIISEADAIILTSTTIFNNTFQKIIELSNNSSDIFMLGPSTILDINMFSYRNIKLIIFIILI